MSPLRIAGQARPAASTRRRRRDRHGRGRRGVLAPPDVPLTRSRAEQFDDLVLDAVEDLEQTWAAEMAPLQFAVEDVPGPVADEFSPDVVADHGVVLAELLRPEQGSPTSDAVVVIYRRPVEARAGDGDERADLVFGLVVELVAEWLGKDVEDIDPR